MADDALPPVELETVPAPVDLPVDVVPELADAPAAPEPEPAEKPKRKARLAKPDAAPEALVPPAKVKRKARPAPAATPVVEARPLKARPVRAKRTPAIPPVTAKPSIPAKPVAKAKPFARPKPLSEIFPMATTDFTATIKSALADVPGKAKAAYEKGAASLSEGTEFAKGNVEAVVESSKILVEGLQKLGTDLVAESKGAFETLTAEAKDLAAAKTPTDFFKLQSDLLRKHFDSAVAFNSKQTEAFVKLGTESIAPISRRVTLALEAIKKAA
jgi:phasin family protein